MPGCIIKIVIHRPHKFFYVFNSRVNIRFNLFDIFFLLNSIIQQSQGLYLFIYLKYFDKTFVNSSK